MDIQGEIAATAASPRVQPVPDVSPRPSGDFRRSLDISRRSIDANRLSTHSHSDHNRLSIGHIFGHKHSRSKSKEIDNSHLQVPNTSSDNDTSLVQSVAAGPVDARAANAITAHNHARNIQSGLADRDSTVEAGPAGTTAAGPSHAPEKLGSTDNVASVQRTVSPQATSDAAELDRLLTGLKEDPMGAVQLGEDGVMRSFSASREIIDAVALSPALIKVWFARMPPGLRELLGEEDYSGVDGTKVSREQMFNRDVGQLPPALSESTLELRRRTIEGQREKEGAVRETTEKEEKKGLEVKSEEVGANAQDVEEQTEGNKKVGRKMSKGGSKEKCGFLTAAKRRIF